MSIAVTPEAIRPRPAPAAEWGSTLASDAWLVSARADFWIVAAGGTSLLLVMGLVRSGTAIASRHRGPPPSKLHLVPRTCDRPRQVAHDAA
jgi:hypothetical protein